MRRAIGIVTSLVGYVRAGVVSRVSVGTREGVGSIVYHAQRGPSVGEALLPIALRRAFESDVIIEDLAYSRSYE